MTRSTRGASACRKVHLDRRQAREAVEDEATQIVAEGGLRAQAFRRQPHDAFIVVEVLGDDALLIGGVERAQFADLARKPPRPARAPKRRLCRDPPGSTMWTLISSMVSRSASTKPGKRAARAK